jgi:hypothetical protein
MCGNDCPMKCLLVISFACATASWPVSAAGTETEATLDPENQAAQESVEGPAEPQMTGTRAGDESAARDSSLAATDFAIEAPVVAERDKEDAELPNAITFERFTLRGVAVQWFKTDNLLQLFNPLAPARYGSGDRNLVHDPFTGRPKGFTIFAIDFGKPRDRK